MADSKAYDKNILDLSKNLMLIIHNLGRFASYQEIRSVAIERYSDLDKRLDGFSDGNLDPLLAFFKTLNCIFNVFTLDNETYISLFREYNGVYARLGHAILDVRDIARENIIAKSDCTKLRRLPNVNNSSEYNFVKITLTVLDTIRTLREEFPEGINCMTIKELYSHCKNKFTAFGRAVLDFCHARGNEEKGFIKFLSYFDEVFKVQIQPFVTHASVVTLDRNKYKFLEKATELDVIFSYLGVCILNDCSIPKLVSELQEFIKQAQITVSVTEEMITALLTGRVDFFVPGNQTVRYLPLNLGIIYGPSITFVEEFFHDYVKTEKVKFYECKEILLRERPELKDELKKIDSVAIACRLYLRSDLFYFKDGFIYPAPSPSHNFIYLVFEMTPVEAPIYLEADEMPDEFPLFFQANGFMSDIGVKTAIVKGEQIIDPNVQDKEDDESRDFETTCFCDVSITLVNGARIEDFSKLFSVGESIEFKFTFDENKSIDHPLFFTVLEIIKNDSSLVPKLSESDCKDSRTQATDYLSEVRIQLQPKQCRDYARHPSLSEVSARQRWIERTIKNLEQKERLRQYLLLKYRWEAGNLPVSPKKVFLPETPTHITESNLASPSKHEHSNAALQSNGMTEVSSENNLKTPVSAADRKSNRSVSSFEETPTKTENISVLEVTETVESEAAAVQTNNEKGESDQMSTAKTEPDSVNAQISRLCRTISEHFQKIRIKNPRHKTGNKSPALSNQSTLSLLPKSDEPNTDEPLSRDPKVGNPVCESSKTNKVSATETLASASTPSNTIASCQNPPAKLNSESSTQSHIPDEKTGARPEVTISVKEQSENVQPANTSLSPKRRVPLEMNPDQGSPSQSTSPKKQKPEQ